MASPAQITANRANAAHSTGPRTPEGRQRCASNAVRHGLTAAHAVVREGERDAYDSLRAALLAELDPVGAVETVVFEEVLHAAWNLDRFRRLEAERGASLDDPETVAFLDRLARYQSRAQRSFYRALKELRVLQTNRTLRALKLTEEQDEEVPAIADINELTKQSQSEVTEKAIEMAVKMMDYEVGVMRVGARQNAAARQEPPTTSKPRHDPISNPALRL